MDAHIAAFIGISAALVVVPGPDMILIAKNTIARGRRSGFTTGAGTMVGILLHAVAAILGLSAIVATSATAFTVVKLAGAAYLIYLGVQTLRGSKDADVTPREAVVESRNSGFVQGLVTNVLNPKVALFFLTFLPQFVDPAAALIEQTLLLAGTFWLMGAAWLALYTLLVHRISVFFARPRIARGLERVTGVILVGLGMRLAVERR